MYLNSLKQLKFPNVAHLPPLSLEHILKWKSLSGHALILKRLQQGDCWHKDLSELFESNKQHYPAVETVLQELISGGFVHHLAITFPGKPTKHMYSLKMNVFDFMVANSQEQKNTDDVTDGWITVEEACKLSGLTRSTLATYRAMESGPPARNIKNVVYYKAQEFMEWCKSRPTNQNKFSTQWITSKQAARILRVSRTFINRLRHQKESLLVFKLVHAHKLLYSKKSVEAELERLLKLRQSVSMCKTLNRT